MRHLDVRTLYILFDDDITVMDCNRETIRASQQLCNSFLFCVLKTPHLYFLRYDVTLRIITVV